MRRVVIGLMVALAAGLMPAGSAAPLPQTDASDEPAVEGPLTLTDTKCDRKTRTSDGQTVAVIKRCLRFYSFDTTAESGVESDFGVVWLQSNVDSRNGWCTKRAASDVLLPEGVQVHSFSPKGPTEIEQVRTFTTRLVADAGGYATDEGRVSQQWVAYPMKVRGLMRDEGRTFRVKWAGTTKAKLAFAGGVEISWPPETPPDGLSYRLNFALGSPDTC